MPQRTSRKQRETEKAEPDLTPMIDVTFQLLIFFILCSRFTTPERAQLVDLPLSEGPENKPEIPKEQLTVYCQWDDTSATNKYVLAVGARGRKPVLATRAGLQELVILPTDSNAEISTKRERYRRIHVALVMAIQQYVRDSGAKIEKIEISVAKNASLGARSGTAPWMFVSAAIDAGAALNQQREKANQPVLPVVFKFIDAQGKYGP